MRAGIGLLGLFALGYGVVGCGSTTADNLFAGNVSSQDAGKDSGGASGADSDAGSGGNAGNGEAGSGGATGGSGGNAGNGEAGSGGATGGSGGYAGNGEAGTGGSGGSETVHTKCGWLTSKAYYACGGIGTSPVEPIDCPAGLVKNGNCQGVTGLGCCDSMDNNWYCKNSVLVQDICQTQTPGTITCGTTSCQLESQACCLTLVPLQGTCTTPQASCKGTALRCDSSADCKNGQLCCGAQENNAYKLFECKDACDGTNEFEMCKLGVDNPCLGEGTCALSTKLPTYAVCQ